MKRSAVSGSLLAVVLLAFALPFYEVSCEGRTVAEVSGYKAAVHAPRVPTAEGEGRLHTTWIVLAPILAVAGIVLAGVAALRPDRRQPLVGTAACAALATLVIAVHSVALRWQLRSALASAAVDPGRPNPELDARIAQGIAVHPRVGWYLALAAAAAATAAALLALRGRAPSAAGEPPAGEPPAGG